MQFLYILISNPNDIYYEQFILSITSLRLIMPSAVVVLLCDTKTKENLVVNRAGYEKLVNKVITVNAPDDMPQVEVSRWIKTSMRRLVSGDFLYIDNDTIIVEDLSSISDTEIKFGACLDKHSLLDKHHKADNIIERDKFLGFSSYLSNRHINSGIIYCVDTPEAHKAFDRWHELWKFSNSKNVVRDQPSFNMAIYENSSIFTELDGIWNCQISFNGLRFLANSKIIHYFASDLSLHETPFILASDSILKKIKETGKIPEETVKFLTNPRTAFVSECQIISGEKMLSVFNSNIFDVIFRIKAKSPKLFIFIDNLFFGLKKIIKFFILIFSKKVKKYY